MFESASVLQTHRHRNVHDWCWSCLKGLLLSCSLYGETWETEGPARPQREENGLTLADEERNQNIADDLWLALNLTYTLSSCVSRCVKEALTFGWCNGFDLSLACHNTGMWWVSCEVGGDWSTLTTCPLRSHALNYFHDNERCRDISCSSVVGGNYFTSAAGVWEAAIREKGLSIKPSLWQLTRSLGVMWLPCPCISRLRFIWCTSS